MQSVPRVEPFGASAPRSPPLAAVTARPRLWADRAAGVVVSAGGIAVILSLVAILVFLVAETAPLFRGATVAPGRALAASDGTIAALFVEPRLSHVAAADADGHVRVYPLGGGPAELETAFAGGAPRAVASVPGESAFAALGADGVVRIQPLEWGVVYGDDRRTVTPAAGAPIELALQPGERAVGAFTARGTPQRATAAAALGDGTLEVVSKQVALNEFSGESSVSERRASAPAPDGLAFLALDPPQQVLFGASAAGAVYAWELREDGIHGPDAADAGKPVTALALLVGGRSLVAGHADGSLSVWFRLRAGRARTELVRAHAFDSQGGAIRALAPSGRGRSFLALGDGGTLGLYHSTSERVLWRGASGTADARALALSLRGDAAFLAAPTGIAELAIANPHPEVSLSALFGRVWYEGYPEPAFVWQSTGGSEDFEPKLSLVPLWVGTLKGTLYSLFLAIPLGVFGAIYTSQFMHPRVQRWVKPAVEIMASLPSVVLGFLAGLWLAPRLEHVFPGFLAAVAVGPLLALAAGAALRRCPRGWRSACRRAARSRSPRPRSAAAPRCASSSRPSSSACSSAATSRAGCSRRTGLGYDQRNAIVVGLAMGFAVIPIIFAIAEDAFSNVPRDARRRARSRSARPAGRRSTRVVLPTASPGIFAAIMIGFGRAVGETMIVLMATGNTPILDCQPVQRLPHAVGEHRGRDSRGAAGRDALPRAVPRRAAAVRRDLRRQHRLAELVRQRLRRRYARLA